MPPFVSSTFSRTTSQLSRNVANSDIAKRRERIQEINRQISTGKKVLTPSDNPRASDLIKDFSRRSSQNETFLNNVKRVKGRLSSTGDHLDQAQEIASKAGELATKEASDTATKETRAATAEEVGGLFNQAVGVGNAKFEGRFLFGGDQTQSAPFKKVGNTVAFTGSLAQLEEQIAGGGINIDSNITAEEAFGAVTKEVEGRVDLDPDLTTSTRLQNVNGGEGVRTGKIEVSSSSGSGTEVDLGDADTIEDVITRIDEKVADVDASIAASGDALRLEDTSVPGGSVTVQEVTGNTASDLGILTDDSGDPSPVVGDDLDPGVTRQTSFPGGLGPGVDDTGIQIVNETGQNTFSASLDFSNANDVGDIIDKINESGTHVTAKINEEGTGIDVVNRLQAGRLKINENGGTTAEDLGIKTSLGRFSLENLNDGHGVNQGEGDDLRISDRAGNTFDIDVSGVDRVEELAGSSGLIANETGGNVELSIDDANNRLVVEDNTGGGGTLEVSNLGGGFTATDLGIKGTGNDSSPNDEITGDSLNPAGFQPESVFTGLVQLRESLRNNNPSGITSAGELIRNGEDKVINAQADLGGRINRLDMTKSRLKTENEHLNENRSELEDADLSKLATELQQERQSLQATLRTVGKIGELSLFRFI